MYGNGTRLTDYVNVPTTVFTPLEYGCIGLSEEDAIAKYGAEDIEVYHSFLTPLEVTVPKRDDNKGYAKLVCVKSLNVNLLIFSILKISFIYFYDSFSGKSGGFPHSITERWRDYSGFRHWIEVGCDQS